MKIPMMAAALLAALLLAGCAGDGARLAGLADNATRDAALRDWSTAKIERFRIALTLADRVGDDAASMCYPAIISALTALQEYRDLIPEGEAETAGPLDPVAFQRARDLKIILDGPRLDSVRTRCAALKDDVVGDALDVLSLFRRVF